MEIHFRHSLLLSHPFLSQLAIEFGKILHSNEQASNEACLEFLEPLLAWEEVKNGTYRGEIWHARPPHPRHLHIPELTTLGPNWIFNEYFSELI